MRCFSWDCRNQPTWQATVKRKHPGQDKEVIVSYPLCNTHLNWTSKYMANYEHNVSPVVINRDLAPFTPN